MDERKEVSVKRWFICQATGCRSREIVKELVNPCETDVTIPSNWTIARLNYGKQKSYCPKHEITIQIGKKGIS